MIKSDLSWSVLLIAVSYLSLILLLPTTGDEGDSIQHYLISRYSWVHPHLLFDHWGKPIFTILSSPFSQFGFKGIQIFNLINLTGTQIALYLIGSELKLKNPLLPAVLFPFIPIVLLTTPSGLTEPLFAHISTWTLYLLTQKNWVTAALLASILPFVRSEGLVVLIVLFTYFAAVRQLAISLLLATGHLVLGLAGMKYYSGDFLWPITQIPYPAGGGFYGKGSWMHYIENLPKVTGILGTLLLVVGFTGSIFNSGKNSSDPDKPYQWHILITGSFLAVLFFHTYAWATGRFNSFGLLRVLTAVMPQASLLIGLGVELLSSKLKAPKMNNIKLSWALAGLFLLVDLGIFTKNRNKLIEKNAIQLSIDQAIQKLNSLNIPYANNLSLQACPYVYIKTGKDPFGPYAEPIHAVAEKNRRFQKGTVLLWDEYYSESHYKISKENILNDPRFEVITEFYTESKQGDKKQMIILKVKDEFATDYNSTSTQESLTAIMANIQADPAWMVKIKKQADYNAISIDSCVRLNARYMIERP